MGERFNQLMWSLLKSGATDFVETGSGYGHTAGVVAERYDVAVWTCEPHPEQAKIVKKVLAKFPNAHFKKAVSEKYLPLIIPELGTLPLFFLDAHGASAEDRGAPCPVLEELQIIGDLCDQAVILAHDVKVPGHGGLYFWHYEGFQLDLNYISPALDKGRHRLYVPSYDPLPGEEGKVAGYALIFQDVAPFGDLKDVREWRL